MGVVWEIDSEPSGLGELTRVIGRHGDRTGPRLVCLAGLHGNEPAGILALRRVFRKIENGKFSFRGELVGLAGNLPALSQGKRHVERDLNRVWLKDRIDALLSGRVDSADDAEHLALLKALQSEFSTETETVHFMDLHTTSAPGLPFVLFGDTIRNRRFGLQLGVPIVLGLEEQLSGTVSEYTNTMGAVSVAFEAGQHDDPASIDRHEAAIWIALATAGIVVEADSEDVAKARRILKEASAATPPVLEVRYRHVINGSDAFVMEPGFLSFNEVNANQLLARDKRGEVRAPLAGRLLLPLYQVQGNDGFFIATAVKPFWLALSKSVRRLHIDKLLRLLPGVRKAKDRTGTLIVNPIVARWCSVQLFHLLGYRRVHSENGQYVFTRREHDDPSTRHPRSAGKNTAKT